MTSGTGHAIERSSVLFEEISAFDFGKVVEKYGKDYKASPDAAHEVLLELKRWLTLCVLHPQKPYATGGRVDDMWHTFILFTKDYARFCQDIAGAFIHHSPDVGSDNPEEQEASAKRMSDNAQLLETDYLKYFGAPPPSHIWPTSGSSPVLDTAFRFLKAMSRT